LTERRKAAGNSYRGGEVLPVVKGVAHGTDAAVHPVGPNIQEKVDRPQLSENFVTDRRSGESLTHSSQ